MLSPNPSKATKPSGQELKAEADRLLARYPVSCECPIWAAAISTEDRIAEELADDAMHWQHFWESKPERRFAVKNFNAGNTGAKDPR